MKSNYHKYIRIAAITAIVFTAGNVNAKVTLPSVFSDNMVIQQKTNAAFWGQASPGKTVNIHVAWNPKNFTVKADENGNWKIKIPTPKYGGPYNITISDGTAVKLSNIMLGDVWVCSGQSNMEMPLAGWGKIANYKEEISKADFKNIRLLQADHIASNTPLTDAKVANGGWTVCTPENIGEFSSVAYFFAREVYQKTGIPIGLIHTSWGGTIAEAWMSSSTLKTRPDFAAAVEKIAKTGSQAEFEQELNSWNKIVIENDNGYQQGKLRWVNADTDDSDWKSMNLPVLWDQSILPDLDGIVYFRKKITIPESWKGKTITLNLGTIDDNDVTFFNGTKIGETKGYDQKRVYTIPADLVKPGENTIAVRVFDGAGGGGIYGDRNIISVVSANGEKISLDGDWLYNIGLDLKKILPMPSPIDGPNRPTVLFNAMINPFLNFTIKGALWYQGESNADRANQYRTLFPQLIQDWRKAWDIGDFPFYFVQLAGYMKHEDLPKASAWAELRDAQLGALKISNTGMAVAIDIGDAADIHPKNKQEVGRRLALIALAKTYGRQIAYAGPVFKSYKIEEDKVTLDFDHIEGGLKANDGKPLNGFAVAGADKVFHWAQATITGNQIVVSSTEVPKPLAVRYGWANNPECNLYNQANLPASPFKTDTWEDSTKNIH